MLIGARLFFVSCSSHPIGGDFVKGRSLKTCPSAASGVVWLMMLSLARSRLLPVPWLILWMLVVPLIHVHPDADHRHGIPGHVHGGTVHTLFSQDLECEHGHYHEESGSPGAQPASLPFPGMSAHLLGHPEIGFSLLSSSPDRLSAKQALTDALLADVDATLLDRRCCGAVPGDLCPAPILLLLAHNLSARAPPVTSV